MNDIVQPDRGLPTHDREDRRAAVNISVNLSSYLITAALTMLAVVGAFATYLLDKRLTNIYFWLAFGASILAFVASVFFGGRGTAKVYMKGHKGDWSLTVGSKYFDWQAKACIVGLLAFAALIFATSPKEDDTAQAIMKLQETLVEQLRTQQDNYRDLNRRVLQLQQQMDSLKERRTIPRSGRNVPGPPNLPPR